MIDEDKIYIVVDIEADGPVPGLHSMLSIGAVATDNRAEVSSFYEKILPIEGATQFPPTMKWWNTQPAAWLEVQTDAKPAQMVMRDFCKWLEGLRKQPVFVAHPTGFDYSFVSWYLRKFVGGNPFEASDAEILTLDLRSFIAGKLNIGLESAHRAKLPEHLASANFDHNHTAIDDARGYAEILRNTLNS